MATWNATFELLPRNGNNPGYGADAIRDLKGAIRERLDTEHIFGASETTTGKTGGLHREGSARAAVTDDAALPTDRADTRVSSTTSEIGQVVVDMSILETARTQDGDSLVALNGNYDDQYTKTISLVIPELTTGGTWDHDNTQLVAVFDAQAFMDLISDQTVRGVKLYVHSPEVPAVGVQSTLDATSDHQYDTDDADKVTTAAEIYFAIDDAKYQNLFDPDDIDNQDLVVVGDNGSYVNRNIKANEIHGEALYGTVWV